NFIAGQTRRGEQVIMGIPGPYAVAAFFDPQGAFLRHEVRQVGGSTRLDALRPGKVPREERTRLWELLNSWKSELGFTPGTVSVFSFALPNLGIGIYPLPQYLRDALDDSLPEPDEQYRNECLSDVEEWRRLGRFVVRWGNEYWMNSSGEVTDT